MRSPFLLWEVLVIYYFMSISGRNSKKKEKYFYDVCDKVVPYLKGNRREELINKCDKKIEKIKSSGDYNNGVKQEIRNRIVYSKTYDQISSRILVWDLLVISFNFGSYSKIQQGIIRMVVHEAKIDEMLFEEMEDSIKTLDSIDKEIGWLKHSKKSQERIKLTIDELYDRQNVIEARIKDLVA